MQDGGLVDASSGDGVARPGTAAAAKQHQVTGVLVGATVLAMIVAFAQKIPCRSGAWDEAVKQYQYFCYTDIYPLYEWEGFSQGQVAYIEHEVEYPVLIGGVMQVVACGRRSS